MDDNKTDIKDFLAFAYSFYKTVKEYKINLVYEGEITHQIIKAFTSLTETNMEIDEESTSIQKKVFHVMVESLQNISKHADCLPTENQRKEGKGVFMLGKNGDTYCITSGNVISSTKVPEIKNQLIKINSLDKDGLKTLYKQQIREGRLTQKGGAGLGFIDIAKKTGNKLDFSFLSIDDEFSFFVLTSTISKNI
ncbi:MAG: SiaB family protein kinase [Bacteroidales bacterium]|nr:SiaB family protein kinase [Bacteroidales bacterium]